MDRIYNFAAGPATLPLEVLKEVQKEFLNYNKTGVSILELSHRSQAFSNLIKEIEQDLRDLMHIPSNYKVMFAQGGATTQFAAIAMNLMKNKKADYIVTGIFSKNAAEEAKIFGDVKIVADGSSSQFRKIPDCSNLPIRDDADYVYYCDNNTVYGTKFKAIPNSKGKPLVVDQSSCFLSEPIDVSKFGVVYAGIQKNAGPAGLAIVIVREDLIREKLSFPTPTMLNWKIQSDKESLYNTPNSFAIYFVGKTLKWIKKQGGIEAIQKKNIEKAKLLYDYLDNSKYVKVADVNSRSMMNVTFNCGNEELDKKFIEEASKQGISFIKGHRAVGGMRASIYNAMSKEGVVTLIEFMKKFEKENL
ncbi:MAG: 3-phosphoserine/phosphohydroxythreonine transaminase [Bacilli bacterium]|nr:3-phosphoserine/phosphohydroxythreonine transaminase [Bacilli bacterium]